MELTIGRMSGERALLIRGGTVVPMAGREWFAGDVLKATSLKAATYRPYLQRPVAEALASLEGLHRGMCFRAARRVP